MRKVEESDPRGLSHPGANQHCRQGINKESHPSNNQLTPNFPAISIQYHTHGAFDVMRERDAAASPPCGPLPFPSRRLRTGGGLKSPRQRRGGGGRVGVGEERDVTSRPQNFIFLTRPLASRPCHGLLACFSHRFVPLPFFAEFSCEACVGDSAASLLVKEIKYPT